MRKVAIKILISSMLILGVQYVHAQIYSTQDAIIKEYGNDFARDTTDSGNEYLIFQDRQETDASGEYDRIRVMYFYYIEDKDMKVCYQVDYIEPVSEINSWIKYFNKKFVKSDKMEWKDYEDNISFTVEKKNLGDADVVLVKSRVYSDE